MRNLKLWLVVLVMAAMLPIKTFAQSPAAAIRAVMDKQAADWNRGDLDEFAKGYKNSPDILFMGWPIDRGYAQMLARYKRVYGNKEKMGVLSFGDVEIQPLDASFATLTGRFHLERSAAGGGNADGYYLLVFEKTKTGWRIIRDDSSAMPVKK